MTYLEFFGNVRDLNLLSILLQVCAGSPVQRHHWLGAGQKAARSWSAHPSAGMYWRGIGDDDQSVPVDVLQYRRSGPVGGTGHQRHWLFGAGTIIVTGRNQVRGLTTAAGLWASACMGLAIGSGFYEASIIMCALLYIVLVSLNKLARHVYQERLEPAGICGV